MLYIVKYRAKAGKKTFQWKPKGKDQKYKCNEFEARSRYRFLVAAGERKEKVDGIVPFRVSIDDASVDAPKPVKIRKLQPGADGVLGMPSKAQKLVQFVDEEGAPMGAWAGLAEAS